MRTQLVFWSVVVPARLSAAKLFLEKAACCVLGRFGLDKVIIDLGGGAFEYGQTYVALSRCRTFDGIILKRPVRPQDIKVDERVRDFYETKRYYS